MREHVSQFEHSHCSFFHFLENPFFWLSDSQGGMVCPYRSEVFITLWHCQLQSKCVWYQNNAVKYEGNKRHTGLGVTCINKGFVSSYGTGIIEWQVHSTQLLITVIYYYTTKPNTKRPHVNTRQHLNSTAESTQVFSAMAKIREWSGDGRFSAC